MKKILHPFRKLPLVLLLLSLLNNFSSFSQCTDATLNLTSAIGTDTQSVCNNTPITDITYTVSGGGTGAGVTGLPTGVTGDFSAGIVTINGTPNVAGTYNYTVTTTGTCNQTSATGRLIINLGPNVTANTSADTICSGASIILSGSGASTYTWSGGVTDSVSFIPDSTTAYIVTGTDSSSCTNTDTIIIYVNSLPIVIANTTADTVCTGSSVTLSGSGASLYSWTGGVTDSVSFIPDSTTTYIVTGTDANSCSNTDTITIYKNPSPAPTVTAQTSADSVCPGTSIILSASGASSYLWTNGVIDSVSFIIDSTSTYIVNGTDGNGCSNTDTITITVNPLPTVIANTSDTAVCNGASIILYGSGASSYTWTGAVIDSVSFVPLATDTYTVTGTDGNGCSNTDTITVTVNALPTVTANTSADTVCSGMPVTLNGSGANSYLWSAGVSDGVSFAATSTTNYTVTGTDANSCTNTDTITVYVNSFTSPTVTANTSADTLCAGASLMLTGSGASSYTWTGGITDSVSFIPDSTTAYIVTGTDSSGCTNNDTITIYVNSLPTVIANTTADTVCKGSSVTLSGSGASSYTWTDGVSDGISFIPDSTTTFIVTGSDANSCSDTDTITIYVNSLPTVVANTTADTVCIGSSVTLTGNGASSYTWTGGISDGVSFAATSTTNYTVTGTDVNGCSNTDTITVYVNSLTAPIVTANTSADTVCAGVFIILSGSGASSYTWTGGVTDSISFVPDSTTAYIVTGTDSSSCTNTDTITVYVNSLPTVTANTTADALCAGSPVTLTGNGASLYTWTNGVTDSVSFIPDSTRTYTVTGIDTNNCSNTDTITISVVSAPALTLTLISAVGTDTQTVCKDSAIVTISYSTNAGSVNVSGLPAGVNVSLNTQNDTLTISGAPSVEGTYDYTVTASSSCSPDSILTGSITIGGGNPVIGSSTQTVCLNDSISPLIYNNVGISPNTVSTLPSGVSSVYDSINKILTISGNPTVQGVFNYSVTTYGNCWSYVSDTGAINVNSLPTVSANTTADTVCTGASITLTGSGVSSLTWTGGVTDGLSFIPDSTTTYIVTGIDTNSCSNTDTITINVASSAITLTLISAVGTDTQTVCKNSNIITISYSTNGGAINVSGLPAGITSSLNTQNDTITISGAPSVEGVFNYTVTASNSCSPDSILTGSITVGGSNPAVAGSTTQTVCINDAISPALYSNTSGISPNTVSALPSGVSSVYDSINKILTISGNPSVQGVFNYSVTTYSNCGSYISETGTINVNASPTVTANTIANTVCAGGSATLTGGGASTYTWTGGVSNGVSFTPSSTITYTVTGTDANSCSGTDTITIKVNNIPTVTANASANTVCAGTSVTLTGGGAASYTWTGGVSNGVAFTPSATKTYTVTGTTNGCSNTSTKTITVNSLPDLTTTVNGDTITSNQTGAAYKWLDCTDGNIPIVGATNQSYVVTLNVAFSVVVTKNGCSDTSACVNVNAVGIEEMIGNDQLIVYPNPNSGSFTIESANEGLYSIINELGQTIHQVQLNSNNKFSANIDNLDNGIYFIIGFNNNQTTHQKIVVTK